MSQLELFEPRLCVVKKRDDFDGYGFNLHAEKGKPGQYIGKVDDASPAESAGLRQGDRILEVNGHNINTESHKQVVERIKAVPNVTKLLVIDPKADIHHHQQMALIDKVKKDIEMANGDHVNNNGMAANGTNGSTTNGTSGSEKLIKEEVKAEVKEMEVKEREMTNGNGSATPSPPPQTKLNLTMTAAELRAQLKSKKRPDPKTEGLDVRKKYEIIQKM